MTSRVDTFKQAVVAVIKTALPQLKECVAIGGRFNLDKLLESSFRPPAVYVSVLKSPVDIKPSGQIAMVANCAAYVLTEGKELERDFAAWVIAEAIATLLAKEPQWKTVKVGMPDKAEIDPLISADYRRKGVTLIAVTWQQSINQLGASLFDDSGIVFDELYVNDQPVEVEIPV